MAEILKLIFRYSLKTQTGKISLFNTEVEQPFYITVCQDPGSYTTLQPQARVLHLDTRTSKALPERNAPERHS